VVAAWFRVGPRVSDVQAAATFYRELGFDEVGSVPGPDDLVAMTILQRDGVMLIADAVVDTG
jgi:catechol 2,3-dioxygenase-like lactoylglutathione lyase family enzyme